MTQQKWIDLLERLEVVTRGGELTPVVPKDLDEYEKEHGVKLPRSYRGYCEVFGAGELGMQFRIAVPGYKGKATLYLLEELNRRAHMGLDYEVYSKNPNQHKRGIFFAIDIARSYHFLDPEEVTDEKNHEYAVYTLLSDFELRRTADNFWQFVSDFCFGDKHDQLIKDAPIEKVFMPVTR